MGTALVVIGGLFTERHPQLGNGEEILPGIGHSNLAVGRFYLIVHIGGMSDGAIGTHDATVISRPVYSNGSCITCGGLQAQIEVDVVPPVASVLTDVDDHGLTSGQIDLVLGAVVLVSRNFCGFIAVIRHLINEHGGFAALTKRTGHIQRLVVIEQDIPHRDKPRVQLTVGAVDLRHDVIILVGRLIDTVAVKVILRTGVGSSGGLQCHGIGAVLQAGKAHRRNLVVVAGHCQVIHDHPLSDAVASNRSVHGARAVIGAGIHVHAGTGEGELLLFTYLQQFRRDAAVLGISNIALVIAVGAAAGSLELVVAFKAILKIDVVGGDEVHP